jgi:hypothetical protein
MAASTPVSVGRVNAAGSEDALFLKVFAGEVLTSFERASKTEGQELVRSISSGKSATFPVMGRISAAYHVPGAEITGNDVNHNERVITINDLLVSSVFLSNIEEAKNHWDVRSAYSEEIGRALAFQKDKHVLQMIGRASQQFNAAKSLDNNYVPSEGRVCFLDPEMYYKLANATNAVNVDFSGQGSIAEGTVRKIAGIELRPVAHFVKIDVSTLPGKGSATQGGSFPQAVNLANYEGLVCHPSAVGTVKLMDLAVESEYDIRRQGTLMVAKYAMGHDYLRPEAAVGIKEA